MQEKGCIAWRTQWLLPPQLYNTHHSKFCSSFLSFNLHRWSSSSFFFKLVDSCFSFTSKSMSICRQIKRKIMSKLSMLIWLPGMLWNLSSFLECQWLDIMCCLSQVCSLCLGFWNEFLTEPHIWGVKFVWCVVSPLPWPTRLIFSPGAPIFLPPQKLAYNLSIVCLV